MIRDDASSARMAQGIRGYSKGHSTTTSDKRANDLRPISRFISIMQKVKSSDAAIGISNQSFMTLLYGNL
jgi:hypothetical protein